MLKIEMLDDEGNVTEVVEAKAHRCGPECETPAFCEECGATGATVEILMWTTRDGMEYFVCRADLAKDDYARVAQPILVENPETGEATAPHAASDGWTLDPDGTRKIG